MGENNNNNVGSMIPKTRGSIFSVEQVYSNQLRQIRTESRQKYLKQERSLNKKQVEIDKLVYENRVLRNKNRKL